MKLIDAALDYGKQGWRIFPIVPGRKDEPLVKWGTEATNSIDQIQKWWTRFPNANIGVACGQCGIFVVDVDIKDGRNGKRTLDALEQAGFKLSETRFQRTPSGGLQYVFQGDGPSTQNIIGASLYAGTEISHIDTKGGGGNYGGYVLLPPSRTLDNPARHTKAGMYEWKNGANHALAPIDKWVLDMVGERKIERTDNSAAPVIRMDQESNEEWYIDYLKNDAPYSIEFQYGEGTLLQVAAKGKDRGLTEDVTLDLIDTYYNKDILDGGRCCPPWDYNGPPNNSLRVKVHNAYLYCNETAPGSDTPEAEFADAEVPDLAGLRKADAKAKADLNNHEAAEKNDTLGREPWDTDDDEPTAPPLTPPTREPWDDATTPPPPKPTRETFENLCIDWVYLTMIDRFVERKNLDMILKREVFDQRYDYAKPGKSTKISKVIFGRFNNTMPKLDKPVFVPGGDEFMGKTYNYWRPSEVVAAEGDVTLWNAHLEYLFPDPIARGHVLNWCAWLIQNISLKPKHALLIVGHMPGTGKSFIADVLSLIIGKKNVAPLGHAELGSTFNRWALGSKLLLIEELRALDKREVAHKLHPIITQEEIPINDKGVATFKADNCFGIFAMTNHEAAIPLDDGDRRYLVERTDAVPRDAAYYMALYMILKQPAALAAIAYDLEHRDLGAYDARQRAPETQAKLDMIESSQTDLDSFLISEIGNPPFDRDLICIHDDIIPVIPPRLMRSGPNAGLTRAIASFLRHRLRGFQFDHQHVLSGGRRVRLWCLHGKQGILTKLQPHERVRLYEARGAVERKTADAKVAEDFES
jgi:hypothetical protein